jgi:hypothetical protein
MTVPTSARYDVFLSHSSVDKPAVEELALWLVREGLTPFLDKWHLVPGEDWTDALPQALGDSTTCAVIIGPGDKGGWQNEEVKQALLRRVRERRHEARDRFRIIPVLLPGAKAPGAGEPSAFDFLAEYAWVKFDRTLDEEEPRFRLVCGIRGVAPGPRPGVPIVAGECPYRGLQIFDVAHAELFFGREKLTLDLAEMLRDQIASRGSRLLAVVGPSGSGKSSVVRAGLIPVLKRDALEGSATWRRLIFRPGQDPFENLGIELAKLPGGAGLLAETRSFLGIDRFGRDHDRSLHTAAKLALRDEPPSARLLVVADQFEEVFTLCKSEEERRALIDNLLEAAMIPDGPVVLVLAIRADFLGKCAGYRKLADEISGRQKLIGKMEEDELRWAIEKPARRAGGEIDPGLVELLLRDVGSDPGTLPLLEFALTQLWEQKTGRRMTVDDYEAIGRLNGALKQHADAILANLRKRGQEDICRRIFLDLIEPGEGTEDTRRRVAYGQLAASPQWSEVVETLVRERIVMTDNPDDLKEGSIEIVHEALIQNWTTLQDWVNADRKSMVIRSDLEAAANKWIKNAQHPDFLLRGLPLANAQDWAKDHPEDLSRLSQIAQFLEESQKAEDKSKADEIAAARHLAEEAQARAEAERKIAEEAKAREEAERKRAEEAQARAEAERKVAEEAKAREAAERKRAEEAQARAEAERKVAEEAKAREAAERKQAEEAAEAARKEREAARRLRRRLWVLIGATAAAIVAAGTATKFWYDARSRLADSYADAAQLASQRGAWRKALENFDEALKLHHFCRDPIGLRLGKVRAWVALDEVRNAFDELEDVASRPDLGEHEGEVLLWRADLGQSRDINVEAKERLLKRALAKKLGEADKAYTSGLLATTSDEAICQFRRALELDPFHQQATIRLAWMLSLLGRRQEAHDVLAKAELIFPEDPAPRVIHAFMLASEGKLAEAEALLDWVRDNAHASEGTLTSWRSGVRLIARWHDLDTLLLDQQPGLVRNDFRFLLEFFQTLSIFRNRMKIDSDRMIFIDFPPLLAHWLHRHGPTLLQMLILNYGPPLLRGLILNRGALRGEIDEALRVFPTGLCALIRADLLFEEGKYEDAEKAFIQAAEMPSVVKFCRMARFMALVAQVKLLGQTTPPAALRDRVRQNIQAIMALGDADPERAQYMAGLAAVLIGELDLARSILAEWERRSPRDHEAWAWRAFIERIGGSYGRSMTAAQEALRLKPGHWPALASLKLKSGHWLARASLNRSMEQLREQARALAPPEADTPSPQADDFFNLARTHALCASRPVDEKEPLTSDERADQEAHANRAMAALRRAVDAGWRDAARLAKEPDLDPLRSRDDFRELLLSLLDLAFPSDPFGHSR